jgi:hypothetical protein
LQRKKEIVGRSTATPHVQLAGEPYTQPRLEWFKLFNGDDLNGEILATFHLFEVGVLKIFLSLLCLFLSSSFSFTFFLTDVAKDERTFFKALRTFEYETE